MEKRENKDGKLVRLAQSGDNDAMEQLCAEYKILCACWPALIFS